MLLFISSSPWAESRTRWGQDGRICGEQQHLVQAVQSEQSWTSSARHGGAWQPQASAGSVGWRLRKLEGSHVPFRGGHGGSEEQVSKQARIRVREHGQSSLGS